MNVKLSTIDANEMACFLYPIYHNLMDASSVLF